MTGRLPKDYEVVRESKVGPWLSRRPYEAKRGHFSGEGIQLIKDVLGADALVPMIDCERTLTEVAEHRRCHGKLLTIHRDAPHLGKWMESR